MKIHVYFALFLIVAAFAPLSSAQAQGHNLYCKNNDSTASTRVCLTAHLTAAQERLNEIYEDLPKKLDDKAAADLKALQKTWLIYRDAECMWESSSAEDAVLKQIRELSCMARVTEDRADLLSIAYTDSENKSKPRQYGPLPKWMNTVAKQNPDIFWNYQASKKVDLNCNQKDDYIMKGLKAYNMENFYIAITEATLIGKPKSTLFTFDAVLEEENETTVCNYDIDIVEENEQVSEKEGDIKDAIKSCGMSLVLNSKVCDQKSIKWDGKAYQIVVEETE